MENWLKMTGEQKPEVKDVCSSCQTMNYHLSTITTSVQYVAKKNTTNNRTLCTY